MYGYVIITILIMVNHFVRKLYQLAQRQDAFEAARLLEQIDMEN